MWDKGTPSSEYGSSTNSVSRPMEISGCMMAAVILEETDLERSELEGLNFPKSILDVMGQDTLLTSD